MTEDQFIADLLKREGGYTEDARDAGNANGGATSFGITAKAWGIYKGFGNRQATRAEVRAITREQAIEFYQAWIKKSPFGPIAYKPLRLQLLDFGVNSGNERALRWLQRVLRVPTTSILDDRTRQALAAFPNWLVHEALIAARVRMIHGAVKDGAIDASMEKGLIARALSFSELAV